MGTLKNPLFCFLLAAAVFSIEATPQDELGSPEECIANAEDIDTFPYHLVTRALADKPDQFNVPHLEAITQGVTEIDGGNAFPSYIALFGKDMFPIATDNKHVILAGGLFGKGRVIIAGQESLVLSGGTDPGLIKLTQNAVQWLAQASSLEGINLATWTTESVGNLPATTGVSVQELDPEKTQVYYIPMRHSYPEEDIKKLLAFVENGGGLMIAGQIWAWYNNHNGEVGRALENPGNRMIKGFGAVMGKNVQKAQSVTTSLDMNLYYALKSVWHYDGQEPLSTDAIQAINLYMGIVFTKPTYVDKDFQEIYELAIDTFNGMPDDIDRNVFSRLVAKLLPIVLQQNPTSVKKAIDADKFPGPVPEGSERVTETIKVNGTYIGYPAGFGYAGALSPQWVSTGLWAVAGEVVKVKISVEDLGNLPEDHKIDVLIGCHTDQLYHLPDAKRSPQIFTVNFIYGEESSVANPWGGLIYIRIPHGAQYPMFDVTISNAVKAPYFVLGKHNVEEWKSTLRNHPAPWGELEVKDQMVFSYQSEELRAVDDPEQFLLFYKNIVHEYNFMQGFEGDYRFRAERYVGDATISGGWLHAGYPVMGFMSQVHDMLNTTLSVQGKNWGLYHEIGHNAQWSGYTTSATTESGCNVYAYHIHKNVFNETTRFPMVESDKHILDWVLGGRTSYTGHIAVLSYILMLDAYGFETWRNMNRFYYQNPDQVGKDKYDTFAWVMSDKVMKMNLCPYYEFFTYKLSDRTLESCKKHPDMPNPIIDRYLPALNPPEIQHGQCLSGWIPYGDSCFFVSEGESLKWDEAEVACAKKGPDSHLASCMSQLESYFLSRHMHENNIEGIFYVGISESNQENVAKFLDGSLVPELFPWEPGHPRKDGNKCTAFERGSLYDINCNTKAGFFCKSGPTSCGQKA